MTHDPIPRPKVTVTTLTYSAAGNTKHVAACEHCPWSYSNFVKSDVQEQARRHRDDHRQGRVPAGGAS